MLRPTLRTLFLALHFEAIGAVRIAASLEHGVGRVRKERPGHHDFAGFLFRGDEFIRRLALFDPIHNDRKPIDVSRAGAAAAMKAARNEEEAAVVRSL